MKVKFKLFSTSSSWGKPAKQFAELEDQVNAWLADHPGIKIERAHMLSQPTFGWGLLAVAVWYDQPQATRGSEPAP